MVELHCIISGAAIQAERLFLQAVIFIPKNSSILRRYKRKDGTYEN